MVQFAKLVRGKPSLTPAYQIRRSKIRAFRLVRVYFTSWPCPKIVKEIKVACLPLNLPPDLDSLCHPLFLSFPLFFPHSSLPRRRPPFPLMAQSPIPLLDDSHNNTENSSPSDFHSSVETSPAIVPLSETPASDSGNSPSSSSTRPSPYHHRNSLDLQRSSASTAGRGGCWCVFILHTCITNAPVSTFSCSSLYLH